MILPFLIFATIVTARPGLNVRNSLVPSTIADASIDQKIALYVPRNIKPAVRTIEKYKYGKQDFRDKARRFFDLRPRLFV